MLNLNWWLEGYIMIKISTHIYEELKDSDIQIKKIEEKERVEILNSVKKIYIDPHGKGGWLWEKFIRFEVLSDPMGWSYIESFVKNNECIMFFNQNDEKEMFLIRCGKDLNYILGETWGYEFYITDRECSYLICFNHHDVLFGCGKAEKWLKNISKYPLSETIRKLTVELNLKGADKHTQDWELEVANASQLPQYIDYYKTKKQNVNEATTLMRIILEAYNDYLEMGFKEDTYGTEIKVLLENEYRFHEETIKTYACENDDLEDCFAITPFIRTIRDGRVKNETTY